MVLNTRKKTKGRQKVEMKLMQNRSNLHVTFSKRRSGVFKKAHELAVMCGAEPAVIVFSPGEKVHTYGHPSAKTIIDRYLQGILRTSSTTIMDAPHGNENAEEQTNPSTSGIAIMERRQGNEMVEELNEHLIQLEIVLKAEREKGRMLKLNQLKRQREGERLWEAPIGELSWEQLEKVRKEIEELKFNVDIHKNVIQVAGEGTSPEAGPSVIGHDPHMAYSCASLAAPALSGLGHKEAVKNEVGTSELGHDVSIAHSNGSFFLPTPNGLGHSNASFSLPTPNGLGHETSFSYAAGSSGLGHDASVADSGATFSLSRPVGLGSGTSFAYAPSLSGFSHDAFMPSFGAASSVQAPLGPGRQASFTYATGPSGLGQNAPMPCFNASRSIPASFGFGHGASVTYNPGSSLLGHNAFMADSGVSFGRSGSITTSQIESGAYGIAPDASAPYSMSQQDQRPSPS